MGVLVSHAASMLATNDFLLPNGTFIVVLLIFLVVLGVLWAFVLPPVNRAMEERHKRIREGELAAEQAAQARRATEEERSRIRTEARRQAREMIEAAEAEADRIREELLAQAQRDHDQAVAKAQADVAAAVGAAREALGADQDRLAWELARRVLGRPHEGDGA